MEVGFLDPDEFDVECQVRNISGDPFNRLEKLKKAILNEIKNPVLKPFRAHASARSAPQRELQRCAIKTKELRDWLTATKPKGELDQDQLRRKESKLIHIQDRLNRLYTSTKTYKVQCQTQLVMIGLVLSGVQSLKIGGINLDDTINKINEVPHDDLAELSTSDEEELPKPATKSKNKVTMEEKRIDNNNLNDLNLSQILSSTNIGIEGQPFPAVTPKNSFLHQFSNIISKWKISFGGDAQELPIERFLFRVEHLAETSGIPNAILVDQLGSLLTGVAVNWYWCHLERNPDISWTKLKQDLLDRFQDRRTEHDIRRAIESRKQRHNEPFRVFYNDILALSLQFRTPPEDLEILHIVRRNMRPGLQVVLADQEISSITMLVQRCLALEDVWKRTGYEPEKLCSYKSISEINCEANNDCNYPQHNDDICAIQTTRTSSNEASTNSGTTHRFANRSTNGGNFDICWNCQDIGHRYTDCSKPPKIFCFGCGRPGILKPKCFRCSGNASMRFQTSGNQIPPNSILPRQPAASIPANQNLELPLTTQTQNIK